MSRNPVEEAVGALDERRSARIRARTLVLKGGWPRGAMHARLVQQGYPADLAEEVIRLEGYENIPARMPRALAGRGLTPRQRLRRSVGRTLAESGYVEILSSPFGSRSDADLLGLPPEEVAQLDSEPMISFHNRSTP